MVVATAATTKASPLLGVLSLSKMMTTKASAQQQPMAADRVDPAMLLKSTVSSHHSNAEQLFGIPPEDNGGGQQPACYPGWDESCQDDPTFVSPLSLPCSGHQTFDCRMTDIIGFTEDEIYALVNACPCSCRIKCGTHTKEPTLSPTSAPTISPQPTKTPS